MRRSFALLCLLLSTSSCASLRDGTPATTSASAGVATQFWFRGAIQSDGPVLQANLATDVPLKNDVTVQIGTWGNMELSNDTGDAALPNGNGGQLDEIDLYANASRTFGAIDTSVGLASYNFPNEVGASTHELFVSGATSTGPVGHALTLYYDFDAVEDAYLNYQASHSVALDDELDLGLSVLLGYMGSDQAAAYFGLEDSGLSDLSFNATLSWAYDEITSLYIAGTALTVPDSDLADSLEDNGFDDSGFWISVGASWSL